MRKNYLCEEKRSQWDGMYEGPDYKDATNFSQA